MTYNDIIASINFKVENSTFERFTLDQVIDELNITYRDLANKTSLFETHEFMALHDGNIEYTLPHGMMRPTRAIYRGEKIDFVSQEDMDLNIPGWETHTVKNKLEYLVYNNLGDRLIKPYPVLTDTNISVDSSSVRLLGELSDINEPIKKYLYLNILSGAKYITDKPFGTIASLDISEVVTIYGAYLPPRVLEINLDRDDIDIDEVAVNALIFGTAGNLLFTSGRTEDRSKGEAFMRIYGIEDTEVGAIKKNDFTGRFRNTARKNYRTPFDN